jgi:hypothetical protein
VLEAAEENNAKTFGISFQWIGSSVFQFFGFGRDVYHAGVKYLGG